jgi:hypothetical protein
MDVPIEHEAFAGRGLALRSGGMFSGPRLLIDGAEVKGKRLRFSLRDNTGNTREVRLRSNGFDPIPKVEIEGRTLVLARPLAWYEYAWMGLPIVLVFAGGALGVLFGLSAVYTSARVFRGDGSATAKYGLSALISLGASAAFFACVIALQLWVGEPAAG